MLEHVSILDPNRKGEAVTLLKIPGGGYLNEAGLSSSLDDSDTLDPLFSLPIMDFNFNISVVPFSLNCSYLDCKDPNGAGWIFRGFSSSRVPA